MGWMRHGVAMNHFDQRFPLASSRDPVLLLTQASEEDVMKAFPNAKPATQIRSAVVESEAIVYRAWWLN
jgi:hypothetical protein